MVAKMQLYNEKPSSEVSFQCSTRSESSSLGSTEIQGSSDLQSCPAQVYSQVRLQLWATNSSLKSVTISGTFSLQPTPQKQWEQADLHVWHQELVSRLAPQGCRSGYALGTHGSMAPFPLWETGKGINRD